MSEILNINKNHFKNFCYSIFLALLAVVGIIFYNKAVIAQGAESYKLLAVASIQALVSIKVLIVVALLASVIYISLTRGEKVSSFVFKHRFLLCAIVLAILVGFGISGSSIGMWSAYTGEDQSGLLAGIPRAIRSDEWLVSTPMALSQYEDTTGPFQYFSNVVRGTSTDVFLEYGLPVLDIVEVFRPFHWGYLFLPPAQGLSFYWCGRLIALFIISFEFGRLITEDKRYLALIYACLITFAPLVQWWFATNGIVEILLYAQLATLAFKEFLLANDNLLKRLGCFVVICLCIGGYALTLYPPWQIPVAYVILALEVYIFLTYKGKTVFHAKDVLGCVCCFVVFAVIFARVLILSKDTIITIMNTAYPGNRDFYGGGCAYGLFKYVGSIFFPMKSEGFSSNVCENSFFIDFFPASLILPLYVLLIQKKHDTLMICVLVVAVFLEVYAIVGPPHFIEKITLLNKCHPHKVLQVAGFANVILLIRSISMMSSCKRNVALVFAILFAITTALFGKLVLSEYITIKFAFVIFLVFGAVLFLLLDHSSHRVLCSVFVAVVMLFVGGLVNPVQKGLDCVYEQPSYKLVKEIQEADPSAIWAEESTSSIYSNLLITAGARTVNSVNVYPNIERWKLIDSNSDNEDIYNRYAHIALSLKESGNPEFSLLYSDVFSVTLTPVDAKRVGVKYVFTVNNLSERFSNDEVRLVDESGNFKVYELV